MIKQVTIKTLPHWSRLASQLWSSNQETLEEAFRQGKFPYEFLYEKNGEVVAFMSLAIRKDDVEGATIRPIAYLEGIYVLEPHRQQDVAHDLVAYAKDWAKKQGFCQLASDCACENTISQAFHQKQGFQEVGRSVHYILDL